MTDLSSYPAPWTVEASADGWAILDGRQFFVTGLHRIPTKELAEHIALWRNSEDVMMRRGWGAMEFFLPDGKRVFKVFGNGLDSAVLRNMPRLRDDPFTALVAADTWMKQHEASKLEDEK